MYCINCGNEIGENAVVCARCGAAAVKVGQTAPSKPIVAVKPIERVAPVEQGGAAKKGENNLAAAIALLCATAAVFLIVFIVWMIGRYGVGSYRMYYDAGVYLFIFYCIFAGADIRAIKYFANKNTNKTAKKLLDAAMLVAVISFVPFIIMLALSFGVPVINAW